MECSMIVEPNPRRVGGFTLGPSCSRQSMIKSPFGSRRQSIVTHPRWSQSAPYLAELVISSWMTSDRMEKASGARAIGAPVRCGTP
jgi:hypothetical protein